MGEGATTGSAEDSTAPVDALSVVINAEPILEKRDRGKVKYRLL